MKLTTKPTTMLLVEDLMQPPHNLDPIRVIRAVQAALKMSADQNSKPQ